MNKNIIIGIAILVLAAAGWLFFGRNKAITPNPKEITAPAGNEEEQVIPKNESFSGTIIDLMNKKASMKCTAKFEMGGETQTQTVYSDGKNMRAEVAMTLPTGTTNSYVIVKDDWEYMWGDTGTMGSTNSGIKVRFTELDRQKQQELATSNPNQGNETQKTMDFNCQPWVAEASRFEIPAAVTFQDMTASMQQTLDRVPPQTPQDACGACKMMPTDEMRSQCEQTNKCPGN